jgi:hypothetical protein
VQQPEGDYDDQAGDKQIGSSLREIAASHYSPQGAEHADVQSGITAGICNQRNRVQSVFAEPQS